MVVLYLLFLVVLVRCFYLDRINGWKILGIRSNIWNKLFRIEFVDEGYVFWIVLYSFGVIKLRS